MRLGSAPLSTDTGLASIKPPIPMISYQPGPGAVAREAREAYVERALSFVDASVLAPLNILVNPGHGTAGPALLNQISTTIASMRFHKASAVIEQRLAVTDRPYQTDPAERLPP